MIGQDEFVPRKETAENTKMQWARRQSDENFGNERTSAGPTVGRLVDRPLKAS
jgi:hypothetical protein